MPSATGLCLSPLAPLLGVPARAPAPAGFADVVAQLAGVAAVAAGGVAGSMLGRGAACHDMDLPVPAYVEGWAARAASNAGDGGLAPVAMHQPRPAQAAQLAVLTGCARVGAAVGGKVAAAGHPVKAAELEGDSKVAALPVPAPGAAAQVAAEPAAVSGGGLAQPRGGAGDHSAAVPVVGSGAGTEPDMGGEQVALVPPELARMAPQAQAQPAALHRRAADAPAARPLAAAFTPPGPAPAVAQMDVARQVAPAVAAPAVVVEKAVPAEPGALRQQGMLPHGTAPIQPAPPEIGAATRVAGHGARQDPPAPAPALPGTVADIQAPASGSVAAAAWPGRQAVAEEGAGAATPDAGPLGSASAPTGARPAAKMDERPKPLAPSVQPQAAGVRAGGVVAEATQAGAQPHPHVAAVSRALATATADAAAQAELPEAPPQSAVTGAVQQTPLRPAAVAPAALPVPVRTGPAGSAAPAATPVASGDAAPAKPVLAGAVPAVSGGPAAAPPMGAAADSAAPAPAPAVPAVASPAPVGAIAPGTMALAPVQAAAGAAAPAVAPAEQAAPVAPAAQLGHAVAAVQIGVGGSGHVTIRLQPAELGHVQISISRDTAGAASVSVAVERPETLSRLQADLGHLHQALDRAGLPEQRSVSLHLAAGQDGQPPSGAGGGGGQGAPQGSAGGFQQGSGQGRQAAGQAAMQPGSAAPGGEATVLAEAGGSWVRAGVNVTA